MSEGMVMTRPVLEGAAPEASGAFAGFVRSGATVEMKAFTGVTGDAGGYAVPEEIDAKIDRVLSTMSPIRAVANVVKVGSADIAANSLSIAFGNFRMGYIIAERAETAILRDPYSNKPFVNFYATKRLGGCVTNSQAIKLMKFAAS